MSSFQTINYCQGEGGKMMNLFKAFNLCVCVCARAIWDVEIAQQLGLFMLVWAKTFSCVLNLQSFEKQDLITRSSWILNVFATEHMKLNWLWRRAPQEAAAGVTDACTCPQRDLIIHLTISRWWILNSRRNVRWISRRKSQSESWILNDCGLLSMLKTKHYQVIPSGHIIYGVLINKISEI